MSPGDVFTEVTDLIAKCPGHVYGILGGSRKILVPVEIRRTRIWLGRRIIGGYQIITVQL
ncbi:hypothetical protein CH305_01525 [Rhodococcus sp. 15-649-2-2]|uniref:hypothetical protein n=1 Tax=Rhodococcus sp. 15-649-2-2 TaxID=2023140 RepID=UPI000B9BCAFB|nr:hypothetical protein [Rhodococcus sp. 15-649-2-2]OZE87863.1 hypothetical protein CH305_01525 [Rhodococcus sp. 15-649-2-2]